jgi:alcohol dehydrogenase (NADP+)
MTRTSLTLANGSPIPSIGLGTFGNDKYSPNQIADAVVDAVEVGYRQIDCASVYGNEPEIGQALEKIQQSGTPREDLWITGKLWNNHHAETDVIPACEKSLKDLRLDYLDLYLVHWPFPNFHAPGVGVDSRDPHAKPYIHADYMRTWCQMELLVRRGLVRHIGTSNVTIVKLEQILRDAEIAPAANEMELHPHFQQPALFDYVVEHGIQPIAYSPLGSPSRPARDRTPEDTSDTDDPVILDIAEKHATSPASVCIKWAVQRGQIPIPFSVKRGQYEESLRATTSPPLTNDEMAAIATIDRNCRLIKGQVFTWPEAAGWEDLWDGAP